MPPAAKAQVGPTSPTSPPYIPAPSSSPDLLLRQLPAELRNRIYELALPSQTLVKIFPSKSRAFEPGLLQTCKQIRAEASAMFYAANSVSIIVPVGSLDKCFAWLRSVRVRCGPRPFAKFRLAVGESDELYNEQMDELATGDVWLPDKFRRFRELGENRKVAMEAASGDFGALWPLVVFFSHNDISVVFEAKGRFPDPEEGLGWGHYGWTNPSVRDGGPRLFLVSAVKDAIEMGTRARLERWGTRFPGQLRQVFVRWILWKRRYPAVRAQLVQRSGGYKWVGKTSKGRETATG
ncbi:hypothetical protein MBLNU230_g1989t1 [Neophaeotheca triangularis]